MAERAINFATRVTGVDKAVSDLKTLATEAEKAAGRIDKAGSDSSGGGAGPSGGFFASIRQGLIRGLNDGGVFAGGIRTGGRIDSLKQILVDELTAVEKRSQAVAAGNKAVTRSLDEMTPALAGSAARAGLLAAGMTVLVSGITIAAGALYKGTVAANDFERGLNALDTSLALSGRSIGLAREDVATLSRELASVTGSARDALGAAQVLAQFSGITGDTFREATAVSLELAEALGTDVASAARSVGEDLQAITVGDIAALNKGLSDLDPEIRRQIVNLVEMGDKAGAQKLLLDRLAGSVAGPTGLDQSINRASAAWKNFLLGLGESDVVVGIIDLLGDMANVLDRVRIQPKLFGSWIGLAPREEAAPASSGSGFNSRRRGPLTRRDEASAEAAVRRQLMPTVEQKLADSTSRILAQMFEESGGGNMAQRSAFERRNRARAEALARELEAKPARAGRARSGKSDAEREAERLAREAERARDAARRIAEGNDDVAASYAQRAADAEALVGKEGAALAAIEKAQAGEAAVRALNREEIEKQVEARRLSEGAAFDEARATAEATAAFDAKAEAVRRDAERLHEATQAQQDFNRAVADAGAIIAATRTPLEQLADDLDRYTKLLNEGRIDSETFARAASRSIDDTARAMADAAIDARREWVGFGEDVSRALVDIVRNGGSARDILLQLIDIPLQRLIEQQIVSPLSQAIDGALGVDPQTEFDKARGQLTAAFPANDGLMQVASSSIRAAAALDAIAGFQGPIGDASVPVDMLAQQTGQAADAMQQLRPVVGQFGGALGQAMAMLSSAGGGGGGGFMQLLSLGVSLFAGAGGFGSSAAYGGATLTGVDGFVGVPGADPLIYHRGTAGVGSGGAERRSGISPLAFMGAPRLHTGNLGLRPGEFAAILERGEPVLSRRQARELRDARSPGRAFSPQISISIAGPVQGDPRYTAEQIGADVARRLAAMERNL